MFGGLKPEKKSWLGMKYLDVSGPCHEKISGTVKITWCLSILPCEGGLWCYFLSIREEHVPRVPVSNAASLRYFLTFACWRSEKVSSP